MAVKDHVYRKLQKHLDNQSIGYPATRSGVELDILRHIFDPDEAEITTCLSYRFEPIVSIFERAKHLVRSREELEGILIAIGKKGGIEHKIKNGIMHYCCLPLVFGMYEGQNKRLTPEFLKIITLTSQQRNSASNSSRPSYHKCVRYRFVRVLR